jgi:hypothetical protein
MRTLSYSFRVGVCGKRLLVQRFQSCQAQGPADFPSQTLRNRFAATREEPGETRMARAQVRLLYRWQHVAEKTVSLVVHARIDPGGAVSGLTTRCGISGALNIAAAQPYNER